jgi:hypothetical protein
MSLQLWISHSSYHLIGGVVVSLTLLGCGNSEDAALLKARPKTVLGSGLVVLNHQPLANATVVLVPTGTGSSARSASAVTDAEGYFVLKTWPPTPGIVPGQYKVSILKMETPGSNPAAGSEAAHEAADRVAPPKSLIPKRYTDADQSGLTAEIPEEGTENLRFDLVE